MFSSKQTPFVEEVTDEVQTTSEKSDDASQEKVISEVQPTREDLQGTDLEDSLNNETIATALANPLFPKLVADISTEFGLDKEPALLIAVNALEVLNAMGLANGDPKSESTQLNMKRAAAVVFIAFISAPAPAPELISQLITMEMAAWRQGRDPLELLANIKRLDAANTASSSFQDQSPFTSPLPQGNSSPMMWRRATPELPPKEEKKEEENRSSCTIL